MEKGTLIVFDGNLMLKSARNRSEKNRMVYTFSVVDGGAYFLEDGHVDVAADGGGKI